MPIQIDHFSSLIASGAPWIVRPWRATADGMHRAPRCGSAQLVAESIGNVRAALARLIRHFVSASLRPSTRAIFLFLCSTANAQVPPPQTKLPVLTRLEEVRRLTTDQAELHFPVRMRAVVTYYDPHGYEPSAAQGGDPDLFIQDSTAGIWVDTTHLQLDLKPGQLVEVEGISAAPDFAPQIDNPHLRVLGQGPMPLARRVSFQSMVSGREDSQWVEVEGIVRSATVSQRHLMLDVAVEGGRFQVQIPGFDQPIPPRLVDARVRIRGACGAIFNRKNQLIGVTLYTPGLAQVFVKAQPPADPFSVPIHPISSLLKYTPQGASGHRVRVKGVVTFQRGGISLFVMDETDSVFASMQQKISVHPGDRVEVIGFPAVGEYTPVLQDGTLRVVGSGPLPVPAKITAAQALDGSYDAKLVQIGARLLDRTLREDDQVLILQAGDTIFNAHLGKAEGGAKLVSLRSGSLLQLTGICSVEVDENRQPRAFRLLLGSPADVVILQRPPWWSVGKAISMLGLLAVAILAVLGWVRALRRRVQSQTEMIRATLESTGDGILVTDRQAKVAAFNQRFVEMWRIPDSVLAARDHNRMLEFATSQLKEHDAYLAKVRQLYAAPDAQSDDLLEFKDGRVFERHSEPQRIRGRNAGRVFGFRDITARKRAEEALRNSEERYRLLFERNLAGVYRTSLEGQVLDCNDAFVRMFGYTSRQEVLNFSARDFYLNPADREVFLSQLRKHKTLSNFENRHRKSDGSTVWILENASLLEGGIIEGTCVDITELKWTEAVLKEANEKLTNWTGELQRRNRETSLLNEMGSLLQTCVAEKEAYSIIGQYAAKFFPSESGALCVLSASRNFAEAVAIWGGGLHGDQVFAPDDCWALRSGRVHLVENPTSGLLCQHVIQSPPAAYLCVPMMAQGDALGVLHLQSELGAESHSDGDKGERLTASVQQLATSVAEHIALALANLRLRETLRRQSIRDPLTGLFNRRYMEESLERELCRAARTRRALAAILLDLDNFKQYNDTFGHEAGDVVLRELGNFLQKQVRGDDIACRYGGEEFVLVLPEATFEGMLRRAEQLREGIKHLDLQLRGQPLGPITLSVGVAVFPEHGKTAEALIRAADAALYRAKADGRDRVAVGETLA